MTRPTRPRLHALARSIERVDALDGLARPLGRAVRNGVKPGRLRDALSGVGLGHALHPLMTDLPIGSWTSATVLDLVGGRGSRRAATQLVGVGVAAALPTAATGLLDWSDTEMADDEVRRVGVVHATSNVVALSMYSASLVARLRGRHGRARLLALAGIGALGVGGHLGGHLAFAKGVGVDATVFGTLPEDWADAGAAADLAEGVPVCREVAGAAVLLVRDRGRAYALADRCSHRGGPLHQGVVEDGCVTCPWHGSRFRLEDGSVDRGPSPYPQPSFDVRERDGRVEVRSAHGEPTV